MASICDRALYECARSPGGHNNQTETTTDCVVCGMLYSSTIAMLHTSIVRIEWYAAYVCGCRPNAFGCPPFIWGAISAGVGNFPRFQNQLPQLGLRSNHTRTSGMETTLRMIDCMGNAAAANVALCYLAHSVSVFRQTGLTLSPRASRVVCLINRLRGSLDVVLLHLRGDYIALLSIRYLHVFF